MLLGLDIKSNFYNSFLSQLLACIEKFYCFKEYIYLSVLVTMRDFFFVFAKKVSLLSDPDPALGPNIDPHPPIDIKMM